MAMVIGLSLANGILFALEHWDDKAPVSIVAPAGTAVKAPVSQPVALPNSTYLVTSNNPTL